MTDHTDLREQISDLLDEFAPVSSTRIVADEIVNRLVAPELDRLHADLHRVRARLQGRIGLLDNCRDNLAEARAELERLRIEPAGYMHASTGETFEAEDLVVITPDGPAAIADTTCHGASSCRSPVHFDSCMSETPGERIPDHRNTEETR